MYVCMDIRHSKEKKTVFGESDFGVAAYCYGRHTMTEDGVRQLDDRHTCHTEAKGVGRVALKRHRQTREEGVNEWEHNL